MKAKTASQKNNDRMLKVIALVCAVLLWFYAEAQENPSKERQLTVPVQYINLASDYVIEQAGQSVQVVVKGNETDIMSLRSDDFSAVVDLSNASIGSNAYPVQVSSRATTEKFTYTPDRVTISIDRIQQKAVPVYVRTEGEVEEHYELKRTEVTPDTVIIRGKSTVIDSITAVETVSLDISGIREDKELIGLLQLPEGVAAQTDGTEFYFDAEVIVRLDVQPIQSQRDMEVAIDVRNVLEGLTAALDTERVFVLLQGEEALLEMQPILDQLTVYVDCQDLTAGTYTLPIQIESANDTLYDSLQSISPQMVTVTLQPGIMTLPATGELNDMTGLDNEVMPAE